MSRQFEGELSSGRSKADSSFRKTIDQSSCSKNPSPTGRTNMQLQPIRSRSFVTHGGYANERSRSMDTARFNRVSKFAVHQKSPAYGTRYQGQLGEDSIEKVPRRYQPLTHSFSNVSANERNFDQEEFGRTNCGSSQDRRRKVSPSRNYDRTLVAKIMAKRGFS